MTIMNKIVTRGFGPSRGFAGQAGPVTMGYGGTPRFIIAALESGIKRRVVGGSGAKRKLNDLQIVIVWAKLMGVNGKTPKNKIEGFVRVPIKNTQVATTVEHVSTRVRKAWEDIKITVKRLK